MIALTISDVRLFIFEVDITISQRELLIQKLSAATSPKTSKNERHNPMDQKSCTELKRSAGRLCRNIVYTGSTPVNFALQEINQI